ncbi:uncharacterized protein LOC120779728 [Bactrocera tryoni]|uniref:Uncharacterized protein LOC125776879 n=1 Tax=Bactrocera dorsalis TaxID=27457 RepID=A0ABM3JBI2_BACDO|nr:uncharacterized protein LOC120779728 [Bactrocera tryoni]XP_049306576.1 uncharacterized protein LOC125776879 [Bactrocera dorsalis]
MEAEMPNTPTPSVRSAVTVPRPKATPVAAPRTTIVPAAHRELPTAPRRDTQARSPEPAPLQCALCRRRHRLPHCGIFKGMTPQQRQQVAQAHGHCLNCLAPTHLTRECTTGYQCQVCMGHHHTMFHRNAGPDVERRHPPRGSTASRRLPRPQPRRQAFPSEESRAWRRHHHTTSHRRRHPRPQARRRTGLSNVVATLQQLQRLLG